MTEPGVGPPDVDLSSPRHVHLIGIGGAGMSGIARMLIQRGHRVSGTDRQEGRALEELRAMGAQVQVGHDEEALRGADVVVRSSAIDERNVEVQAARDRSLPLIHRSQMLAALMEGRRAILITGTHGKTTTTSMAVVALQGAGADPSFAIGGKLNETGSNSHAGSGELFVAEADESDRSFLAYSPDIAVVTNVELDHPEVFDDLDDTLDAFREFLDLRSEGGTAVICVDDPGSARLTDVRGPVVTYGTEPAADIRVVPTDDGGRLRHQGEDLVGFRLAVPGRHNLLNATAALAVCWLVGRDLDDAAEALASFTGAQRRFQQVGTARDVSVVDDYAHHPTELRATLAAARSVTDGRVVCVVQPHRFSRTKVLGAELGRAAAGADVIVVTDVYASDEEPVPGVTGEIVADGAREAGANVIYEPRLGDLPGRLAEMVRPGDLVVLTGAGDVNQVGAELLKRLRDEG
jgi:UDP-N-acetylmuramate--alanine ligase